jgi:putative nucleotidyltransferase with HDIG domain
VVRAIVASFFTVTLVLGIVLVVISIDVRGRVRRSVADNLASAQEMFSSLEARRQREALATVATLAENPTLKAALDTWLTERQAAGTEADELLATVQNEAEKIADRIPSDVLAITDPDGRVIASAGPRSASFPRGARLAAVPESEATTLAIARDGMVFRVSSVMLELQDASVGSLRLGTALSSSSAHDIALLSRGEAAIILNGRVLASTLSPDKASALAASAATTSDTAQKVDLLGESWAVQPLFQIGEARLLALASIDLMAARETKLALASLGWIALGAMSLAVFGSIWLARTLTKPIDQLSRTIASMAGNRATDPLPLSGSSCELDQLAATFNELIAARAAAEADAEATYLGAVRALTASLDARDPYTAGHSERVSTLSVAIGEQMGLDADTIEVLRLGALLHDVGKIGVPDEVLRKRGRLTPSEFDAIKTHPTAGARILRSIPFLARHIPIVELHHERPDGQGYPYGLKGDAIPLGARIVHAADAFDAMTSGRAYRSARLPFEAVAELRRCTGTDFDEESVEALAAALTRLAAGGELAEPVELTWRPQELISA